MIDQKNEGIIITGGSVDAQSIAAGQNARAVTNIANQDLGLDLPELAKELEQLRMALRKEATDREHDAAVVAVGDAAEAAKQGNGSEVLDHLKKAGKWALDVATKIGVSIASDALKKSLGM